MVDGGWQVLEEGDAADPGRALVRSRRVWLKRGEEEFVLVAEPQMGSDGNATQVRVALRRGGGAFAEPGGTYPAVGTIFDSVMVRLSSPAPSLQAISPGDHGRVAQAARQLLEQAGRRLDARG